MINVVARQERTVRSSGKPRHKYPKAKAFALSAAVMIAIWFAPHPAAAQVIHACVNNKTGALRIANTCKKTESALTFNQAGPAGPTGPAGPMGAAGPAGPTGPAGQVGPVANVTQLNLVNGSNQTLATLGAAPKGGGSLTFFDSNEKRLVLVGMSDDATGAGLYGFDGNALAPGSGVTRTEYGLDGPAGAFPGFGMGVGGADGTARIVIGSSLDGTTDPSTVALYDTSGTERTGVGVFPSTNFVGFFSGIYTVSGGHVTGPNESLIGNAYDNSASYSFLFDSSGNLHNGIEYNPATNFNGFFAEDGSSHNLSLLGNALTTGGGVQANESYMDLFDVTGTLRVAEFQNSANEGGVAANPGGTVGSAGGWGNP